MLGVCRELGSNFGVWMGDGWEGETRCQVSGWVNEWWMGESLASELFSFHGALFYFHLI